MAFGPRPAGAGVRPRVVFVTAASLGRRLQKEHRSRVPRDAAERVLIRMSNVTRQRLGVVILLLIGGYFAAAPWLGCVIAPPLWHVTEFALRACTFGDLALRRGYGLPGFDGPYWGNLIVGILYVLAAIMVAARTRRI